jgi:hypothetical protein
VVAGLRGGAQRRVVEIAVGISKRANRLADHLFQALARVGQLLR